MRKALMIAAVLDFASMQAARAQADLSACADTNGYLDVQKLTCGQLAGTWQQDADSRVSDWHN